MSSNRHKPSVSLPAVDVIGDVHGCRDELDALLDKLGWTATKTGLRKPPTKGRKLLFVGDLVNRGPWSVEVLRFVTRMVARDRALTVLGNHDAKFVAWLNKSQGAPRPRFADGLVRLTESPSVSLSKVRALLSDAPVWLHVNVPDASPIVVVHAAWHPKFEKAPLQRVRDYALFGPRVRYSRRGPRFRLDWRRYHKDKHPLCVHGHTAYDGTAEICWNTLCLDTACVFGGRLSALRWPENEIVSVEAHKAYVTHANLLDRPPVLHLGKQVLRSTGWPTGRRTRRRS